MQAVLTGQDAPHGDDAALGRLTRQEFYALRDTAHKRLSEIDDQLADAGRSNVLTRFVDAERDPREVWDDPRCSLSMKRAVIDALCTVRVMPGTPGRPKGGHFDADSVRIEWKSYPQNGCCCPWKSVRSWRET